MERVIIWPTKVICPVECQNTYLAWQKGSNIFTLTAACHFAIFEQFRPFFLFSGGSNGYKKDPPEPEKDPKKCDTCHTDGAVTKLKKRRKRAKFDLNMAK
jgi:hypothetical protein